MAKRIPRIEPQFTVKYQINPRTYKRSYVIGRTGYPPIRIVKMKNKLWKPDVFGSAYYHTLRDAMFDVANGKYD